MKLYRLHTDSRDNPHVYVIAPDPTAAEINLQNMYERARYDYSPLVTEIHLIAEAGIVGKPAILVIP